MSVKQCDRCGSLWGGLVHPDFPTPSNCPFCQGTDMKYTVSVLHMEADGSGPMSITVQANGVSLSIIVPEIIEITMRDDVSLTGWEAKTPDCKTAESGIHRLINMLRQVRT